MNRKVSKRRRGAAAVEFALTAPLLFMILFAALELGHANMVFNLAEAAAFEGAREGIVPGATRQEVEAATNNMLAISNVRGASVTVTPSNLNQNTEFIEVQLSVPYASNTMIPPFFTKGMVIERSCRLTRENTQ